MGKIKRRSLESYDRETEFPPGISWHKSRDYRRESGIVEYKFRIGYDKNNNPLNPSKGIRISDYTDNFIDERNLAWLVFDKARSGGAPFFNGTILNWDEETHFYRDFRRKEKEPTAYESLVELDLISLGLEYRTQVIFEWSKVGHSNYIYDFLLPEYKVLIETDGEQHMKEIALFGGKDGLKNRKEVDEKKERLAIENGYYFLRIPFSQINSSKEILTKFLKSIILEKSKEKEIV